MFDGSMVRWFEVPHHEKHANPILAATHDALEDPL